MSLLSPELEKEFEEFAIATFLNVLNEQNECSDISFLSCVQPSHFDKEEGKIHSINLYQATIPGEDLPFKLSVHFECYGILHPDNIYLSTNIVKTGDFLFQLSNKNVDLFKPIQDKYIHMTVSKEKTLLYEALDNSSTKTTPNKIKRI